MREFIEELKYNQNINMQKGLENRVDIDYVIERLESINMLEDSIREEIDNFIDSELCYDSVQNNQDGVLDYLNSLTEEDKRNIAKEIIRDDYFWDIMNEILNANIYHYRKWGN